MSQNSRIFLEERNPFLMYYSTLHLSPHKFRDIYGTVHEENIPQFLHQYKPKTNSFNVQGTVSSCLKLFKTLGVLKKQKSAQQKTPT